MKEVENLVEELSDKQLPREQDYLKHAESFTVLMAVYIKDDIEDFEIAVKSVLYNTVVPNEILVIVDGPVQADMEQFIVTVKRQLPNVIRIIKQTKNQGRGKTAAYGVVQAKNEIIARMDADDISHLKRFEIQLPLFKKMNVDVVGGQVLEFNDKLEIATRRAVPIRYEEIMKFSKMRSPINQPTVMFRKHSVLKSGNYHDLPFMEDYELWMRMLGDKMIFYNLEDDLVYMRAPREMYRRRGGLDYFIRYKQMRAGLLRQKFISISDYYKSIVGMAFTAFAPVTIRKLMYSVVLRRNTNL